MNVQNKQHPTLFFFFFLLAARQPIAQPDPKQLSQILENSFFVEVAKLMEEGFLLQAYPHS